MDDLKYRLSKELERLAGEERRLCIGFSGGVDSALLVKLACDSGLAVDAVTFDSTLQPLGDAEQAKNQAKSYGARPVLLKVDPLGMEEVRHNSRERCYRCKHTLFSRLLEYARDQGIPGVADGTNGDDLKEYRPGLRALEELGISSPLARLGISKAQVRSLGAAIGLDVAQRPSSPCLATRFPYDTLLTEEMLNRVGQGEEFLHGMGFKVVRVRCHDRLARIEVPVDAMEAFLKKAGEINQAMKALGFCRITLDLEGYRSGSYDRNADS